MTIANLRGVVRGGVVVLENQTALAEGTQVIVTPVSAGSGLAGQSDKKGLAAIYGKWPGDESDEEVERVLKELS